MSYFYNLSGPLPLQPPAPSGSISKRDELITRVWNRNVARQTETIEAWRNAIARAESNFMPLRYELIRMYNEIVLDPHLTALIKQRLSKILSRKIVLKDGEKEMPLQGKWIRDGIKHIWMAKLYGYTLLDLGPVLPGKNGLQFIRSRERHLVSPDLRLWLSWPTILSGENLDDPDFAPWYALINTGELGELNPCVPYALAKRFVFTGWTEFAQVFGLPIIAGTDAPNGNIPGQAAAGNKTEFQVNIEQLGLGGSITMSDGQKVELLQPTSTDAWQIFSKNFDTCNGEMSKCLLGQTMTTENGSSRSQAEVHERVSDDITTEDIAFVEDMWNQELQPRLIALGVFPEGSTIHFESPEKLTVMEKKDVLATLLPAGYKVPAEWIEEQFGIEVEDPEEVDPELDGEGAPPGKPNPQGQAPTKGVKKAQRASEVEASLTLTQSEAEYQIHADIVAGYQRRCKVCGGLHVSDLEAAKTPFDDAYLEGILAGVHGKTFTKENLPEDLYRKTAAWLFGAVNAGTGYIASPDVASARPMVENLRQNVYRFAGAKTYQQISALSALLTTDDGQVRSWPDFKAAAQSIVKDYNVNWLKTEYNTAMSQARSATNWQRFEAEKDTHPYLVIRTAGDSQVRPMHRLLEGITRRVDDPFWDTHHAPFDYNCRCDIEQAPGRTRSTPQRRINDLPPDIINPAFRFNPGRTGQVFSEEKHPYFKVPKADQHLKDDNFGLPIPGVERAEDVYDTMTKMGWQVGTSPSNLAKSLTSGPLQGMNLPELASDMDDLAKIARLNLADKSVDSNTISLKSPDRETIITRTFIRTKAGVEVNHSIFALPNDVQGLGLGKKILRAWVKQYDQMPKLTRIKISTGFDKGGYVWARYGFKANTGEEALAAIQNEHARAFEHQSIHIVKDDTGNSYTLTKAQYLEDVAMLEAFIEQHPNTPFLMKHLSDTKHGRALLMNTQWNGFIDWKDAQQVAILKAYINYDSQ